MKHKELTAEIANLFERERRMPAKPGRNVVILAVDAHSLTCFRDTRGGKTWAVFTDHNAGTLVPQSKILIEDKPDYAAIATKWKEFCSARAKSRSPQFYRKRLVEARDRIRVLSGDDKAVVLYVVLMNEGDEKTPQWRDVTRTDRQAADLLASGTGKRVVVRSMELRGSQKHSVIIDPE